MDMKSNASQDLGLKINLCVCIFSGLWSGCQPGPVLLLVPKLGCIHTDTYLRLPFFLWRFSGITKKTLKNVTTTLDDVQKCLFDLLPHDAILIGHSLENDLRALNLSSFHRLVSTVVRRFAWLLTTRQQKNFVKLSVIFVFFICLLSGVFV